MPLFICLVLLFCFSAPWYRWTKKRVSQNRFLVVLTCLGLGMLGIILLAALIILLVYIGCAAQGWH